LRRRNMSPWGVWNVDQTQKQALQVTKEIVVKFIESNRISPSNFSELFAQIYHAVLTTIRSDASQQDFEDACPEGEDA
jgi:predicted transcriptional regulator